jgi:large subunit ribosomal protein LP1
MVHVTKPEGAEATAELAVSMATLLLFDGEKDVNEDNLNSVIKAAGVDVAPFWVNVFAKALEGQDLNKLTAAPSASSAASAGGAAAAAGGETEAADEKEEEEEESEADIGGGGLFGDDDGY